MSFWYDIKQLTFASATVQSDNQRSADGSRPTTDFRCLQGLLSVCSSCYCRHQASQTRSDELIYPFTVKQLAQLVDREVAKIPCSLTPSEAFSLHALFAQLRQIHAA